MNGAVSVATPQLGSPDLSSAYRIPPDPELAAICLNAALSISFVTP